jgi:hypothetical protein
MDIKKRIDRVIKAASSELSKLKDDYFIIGASALVLSGVKIETSDIDILVSDRDANYLREFWRDKLLEKHITKDNELFQSNFSRYYFGELDIEIMGNLKVCKDSVWLPLIIQDYYEINLGETKVKIPTIEEQKRILLFFGREKDMDKIRLIEKLES